MQVSDVPRSDQLRNSVDGTIRLLEQTGRAVDTLHALAYDRQVADQVRVSGGQPDYALDTNGDPRARAAYKGLAKALSQACVSLTKAAGGASKVLNYGDSPGRNRQHPATATVLEHAEAIAAQARRVQRGEFDAGRTMPQPGSHQAMSALRSKVSKLEARNAALERTLREESHRISDTLADKRVDDARKRRRVKAAVKRMMVAADGKDSESK